jgi:hypothetical protein
MKAFAKAVIGGALFLAMSGSAGWADGSSSSKNIVSWQTMVGVNPLTPLGSNVVAGIMPGGQPWSTLGGKAYVDLLNSVVYFKIKGLALAGGASIGTPATITEVKGTLVCNPGTTPTIIDTPLVPLDGQGNASFYGSVSASTAACSPSAVAFLIRGSNEHWFANGAVQVPFP